MKALLKSLAFLAVATLAGTAFGYGIGDTLVNVAADTIITSTVDDGSGAGKYTDIVKTGAGIEMVEGGARVHVTCRAGGGGGVMGTMGTMGPMGTMGTAGRHSRQCPRCPQSPQKGGTSQ